MTNVTICNSDPDSEDYKCMEDARGKQPELMPIKYFTNTSLTNKTLECRYASIHNKYEIFMPFKVSLQEILREQCGDCESLCEDIVFNYETTIADIQSNSILWHDPTSPKKRPHW